MRRCPREDEKFTYLIGDSLGLALLIDGERRHREIFLGKYALEANFLSVEGPVAKITEQRKK